jgi:hypothetical protein
VRSATGIRMCRISSKCVEMRRGWRPRVAVMMNSQSMSFETLRDFTPHEKNAVSRATGFRSLESAALSMSDHFRVAVRSVLLGVWRESARGSGPGRNQGVREPPPEDGEAEMCSHSAASLSPRSAKGASELYERGLRRQEMLH